MTDATRKVLLSRAINTEAGQLSITWCEDAYSFDGDLKRWFAGQSNGILGAGEPCGLVFMLAFRAGASQVDIELFDGEPHLAASWEDVVEVSANVGNSSVPQWVTCYGAADGPLDLPPGSYRVRFSCRGRDLSEPIGEDDHVSSPVDAYLVEFWPSLWRPDVIVRTSSSDASEWHSAIRRELSC